MIAQLKICELNEKSTYEILSTQNGPVQIKFRSSLFIRTREALPERTEKVNMILPLPESPEALWRGFTAKLRAQIKRPQLENPQILVGGKEYLDDFYWVYARNMRDLGSPAQSILLIENILDSFPDNSWLIVLRTNNKLVSAGLLLGHGDTAGIDHPRSKPTQHEHAVILESVATDHPSRLRGF